MILSEQWFSTLAASLEALRVPFKNPDAQANEIRNSGTETQATVLFFLNI